ncbi:MAG: sugar-transfer associated ATP-grasp domain-containing protein [bacterium]|nr:sugar-transfer associated ATP-grasp domain-containing protein [bacterium]
MRLSSILGLNARSQLFSYQYNPPRGRKIAESKIWSKRVLRREEIPVPKIYKIFRAPQDVLRFDWSSLPDSFVLKPSKGMGGEGIIVVKRRDSDKQSLILSDVRNKQSLALRASDSWITAQRTRVTIDDLKLHTLDILEGAFSLHTAPDVAFIEEYVGRHKTFRRFAYHGTPDIRIIVFNKVPVMAMLRLPTQESGGRANLHQGAIGVGIDIATGITTHATWHGEPVKFKPGTERKLHGIKIPHWDEILETAVRCQEVSGLGYLAVDIVLHPERGPMVLELNSKPGLQIQLANLSGLKKRLERVEDLDVRDAEHGVKLAKALFAGRFADRVALEEGVKTILVWELVKILSDKQEKVEVVSKVDTGAWRTSIDRGLAKNLGLLRKNNILWSKNFKSGLGTEKREVINLTFWLAGRKIKTIASVANRQNLRVHLIIGRRDLRGFLIKPKEVDKSAPWYQALWKRR